MICIIFRRVCFDRAPFSPAAATLLLSALWHGFYPSYYFMFIVISSALVVGRKVQNGGCMTGTLHMSLHIRNSTGARESTH